MDKNTISTYGWTIVAVVIISLLLVSIAPLTQDTVDSFSPSQHENDNRKELGAEQVTHQLSSPTNLNLSEDNTFSFNAVENANKYILIVKSESAVVVSQTIENTSVDLSNELNDVDHPITIEVVAVSDNPLYRNSSTVTYIVS